LQVTLFRRPPFLGHYTASAVFVAGSCVLSLVNVKFVLPSLSLRSGEPHLRLDIAAPSPPPHVPITWGVKISLSVNFYVPISESLCSARTLIILEFIDNFFDAIRLSRGTLASHGIVFLVVLVVLGVMRLPRASSGSNDDRVFIYGHGVSDVGRNEQEAAHRVRLEVLKVGGFSKAYLECTLNNRDLASVAGMGVEVTESGWQKCSVGEGFASNVTSSFKHRPLRSIGVGLLPLNVLSVPGLRLFNLFGGKSSEKVTTRFSSAS
jgi:hypothetical protein